MLKARRGIGAASRAQPDSRVGRSDTNCRRSDDGQIFRTFWHGGPLGPYQVFCLRSFVARGHRVEIFSYEDRLAVPDWVVRKDAQEILPADRILRYRSEPGQGSPSLHSNLFRYTLLHRLGGWWIDMDVVLLRPQLPSSQVFFAAQHGDPGTRFGTAILRLPPEHPLLSEAIEGCRAVGEAARWSQTGPALFTSLVNKHQLARYAAPEAVAYPIAWRDFPLFFDPARCNDVRRCCKQSTFVHLWHEMWRRSRIPCESGPPQGSFLDWLITKLDFDLGFPRRMQFIARADDRRPATPLHG
jgi:hypothetical protein